MVLSKEQPVVSPPLSRIARPGLPGRAMELVENDENEEHLNSWILGSVQPHQTPG